MKKKDKEYLQEVKNLQDEIKNTITSLCSFKGSSYVALSVIDCKNNQSLCDKFLIIVSKIMCILYELFSHDNDYLFSHFNTMKDESGIINYCVTQNFRMPLLIYFKSLDNNLEDSFKKFIWDVCSFDPQTLYIDYYIRRNGKYQKCIE